MQPQHREGETSRSTLMPLLFATLTVVLGFVAPLPTRPTLRSSAIEAGVAASGSPSIDEATATLATAGDLATIEEEYMCALNRATRFGTTTPIILPFKNSNRWLWRQWHGTILEPSWKPTCAIMLAATAFVFAIRLDASWTWPLLAVPNPTHPVVMRLKSLDVMWNYLLTLATFVSSFFISQAYPFWKGTMANVRTVQGRIGDLNLLLATHAVRSTSTSDSPTPEAKCTIDELARLTRAVHVLFWASVVRKSKGDYFRGSLSLLVTDEGLRGLEERGVLTSTEREKLMTTAPMARHNVILGWIGVRFNTAVESGHFVDSNAFRASILAQLTGLRGTFASILDDLAAPMPLAYVHFVQIVTDTVLILAPFALFPKIGALSIVLSGILGLFYRGLLELSKSFLDPFGNAGSIGQNLQIDCLVGETNSGSVRWTEGIDMMPASLS